MLAGMPAHSLACEDERETATTTMVGSIRVVLVYCDIAAGLRAMRLLNEHASDVAEGVEILPLPWSFELLAQPDWREAATRDARHADLVVVVTRNGFVVPPAIERWSRDIAAPRDGSPGRIVARFSADNTPDESGAQPPLPTDSGTEFRSPAGMRHLDQHAELAALLLGVAHDDRSGRHSTR